MIPKKIVTTVALATGFFLASIAQAQPQAPPTPVAGQFLDKSAPDLITAATDLGPEDPDQTIEISVWLNLHNREELDAAAQQLYDPNSVSFHRWLSRQDIAQRFAPTPQEAQTVQAYLSAHGLRNTAVGPYNFFVRAEGSLGTVQNAFRVQINKYHWHGQLLRSNRGEAYLEASVAPLVRAISGLSNPSFRHYNTSTSAILQKANLEPQAAAAPILSQEAQFSSSCFTGVKTMNLTSIDGFPKATYTGNSFSSYPSRQACGYTPAQVRTAYGLDALYAEGYDGTGQDIVIIDWCGSPTIREDANAFSAKFGLPPLTASNFKIIDYPRPSTCAAYDPEINLDVEWAHVVAPGVTITLLVPPTGSLLDIDAAQLYAEEQGLGNVISGSYGMEELYVDSREVQNESLINEIGAVLGISAHFATGDVGDYTLDRPQYAAASVSTPAVSPYATAVGGVALALDANSAIAWQAGWGNNINILSFFNFVQIPQEGDFYAGSGGGSSRYFPKPAYQKNLTGVSRKLPDIAWLADPFTGAIIGITKPGNTSVSYQVIGGTSLACPMFSALWAIANQEAGVSLGQAAPYLYSMPAKTITDIVNVNSPTNVSGSATSNWPYTTTTYSAAQLARPLQGTTNFYSVLWQHENAGAPDSYILLTFGTDSGLRTAPGWDNVTGLGTPNAKAFADYFNPARTH